MTRVRKTHGEGFKFKVAVHDQVKGVMSSLYQPGPYSPIKEEWVEYFVAWYMERLAA